MTPILPLTLLALAGPLAAAVPSQIKLTTLPDREATSVRFEDTGHVLVEEVRTLTIDQGSNQIDFTWLGVNIDRGSIQLLPIEGTSFTVLRTAYPPGDGNRLVWEVQARSAGPAKVRISYLLAGISREIALRAVVAENQPQLDLRVYQRLINNSGESFDATALRAAFGELRDSPLATGEIRQQLAHRFLAVPFSRTYTYDPTRFGVQVAVHYALQNTTQAHLGLGTLPAGKVRMFQATGTSEAFLGEDLAAPTALGEELRLRIGDTKDVTVRRAEMHREQVVLQRDRKNNPALWNEVVHIRYEVENFAGQTRTIRLVEYQQGEWDVIKPVQVLERRLAPEKYEPVKDVKQVPATLTREDARTLFIDLPVPEGLRVVFTAGLRRKNLH